MKDNREKICDIQIKENDQQCIKTISRCLIKTYSFFDLSQTGVHACVSGDMVDSLNRCYTTI